MTTGIAQLLGANFLITLLAAGFMYALAQCGKTIWAFGIGFAFVAWLIGHEVVERVMENRAKHTFLDVVTAGVLG